MSARDAEVIVVGGSVAGAATAAALAVRGRDVLVLDPAEFPREKACGEGLLPPGRRALDKLGVPLPPGRPIRALRFRAGSRTALLPFPGSPGLAVRRLHLDAALRDRARAAGARLVAGRARAVGPGAVVDTDRGRLRARVLVGADGRGSVFHRLPGVRVRRDVSRFGLSTHLRGLAAEDGVVEVVFFRGGEVYLSPVDRDLTLVALLLERSAPARPRTLLPFVRRLLPGRAEGARIATPVLAAAPLATRVRPVAGPDWILVGDAAGAVDPVTGEGMSLALADAEAAADAIAAHLEDGRALADGLRPARRRRRTVSRLTSFVLFAARRPGLAAVLLRRERLLAPLVRIAAGAEAAA